MGSQCTCQGQKTNSEGYFSNTYKPSGSGKTNSQEVTDLEEEYDNPSRERLNQNFLHTSVVASNHRLHLPPKNTDIINQGHNALQLSPTQTSIQKLDSSELSIGKNLDESCSEEQIISQNIINVQSLVPKQRKASIESKIPFIIDCITPKEEIESASMILRQISGYILSQKNLFEPIKIPKENFIRFRNEDIYKSYKFLEKLGEGSYGKVYKVVNKRTNQIRAAKVMKRSTISQQMHQKLMNQIDILRKLDHPNIIKIFEAYIFENVYCIITEYCQGGSLYKYVQAGKQFSDDSIRSIFRKIFSALSYIHKFNILHRDIKLDNIVFVNRAETTGDINTLDIRIIDFGLAKVLTTKRVRDKEKIGTYSHMAPEVINGIYSTKCDVWSTGIVLYSMIAGYSPFKKATKERTYENILKADLEFLGQRWRENNPYLKDLIIKLLNKNMNQRINASTALNHPFLRPPREGESQKKIFEKVTKKFIEYHRGNNLVSMIESYISYTTITQKELQQFSAMFQVLDANSDGFIERKQLQNAFAKSGHSFSKTEINYVLDKIDKNHLGKINYSQFVTILYDRTKLHAKNSIIEAFKYIDSNNDGFLEKEEIKFALKSIDYKQLSSILMQLDENNDNKISQEQFIKYLEDERII